MMLLSLPHKDPIIRNEVKDLEAEARDHQYAMLTRGFSRSGKTKNLSRFILERPLNPYKSRATEALSMAIEASPIQNNDAPGVSIDVNEIQRCWQHLPLYMYRDENCEVHLYVATDSTCVLFYKFAHMSHNLIATIPLKISSKKLTHKATGSKIKLKPYVKPHDHHGRGIVVEMDGESDFIPVTKEKVGMGEIAKAVLEDLINEAFALSCQYCDEIPAYNIEEPADDATMCFYFKDGCSQSYSAEEVQWLNRGTKSFCDIHIPFTNVDHRSLPLVSEIIKDVTRLCILKLGIDVTDICDNIFVESADPLSTENVTVSICGVFSIFPDSFPSLGGDEKKRLVGAIRDELGRLGILNEAFGYRYLFKKGVVSAYQPMSLAFVGIQDIDVEGMTEEMAEWRLSQSVRKLEKHGGIFKK